MVEDYDGNEKNSRSGLCRFKLLLMACVSLDLPSSAERVLFLDINLLIIYADNWSNKTVDVIYLIDNCDELESTPELAYRGEKGQIFYEWKLLELS